MWVVPALLPALCKFNAENFKAYLHNTLHNMCAYLDEILVFVDGLADLSRFSDLKNGSEATIWWKSYTYMHYDGDGMMVIV